MFRISLDKNNKIPFYRQIYIQMADAIRDHSLSPGQILPSMNELADSLGISRETVKKAYVQLRRDKLVVSSQGIGFFVSDDIKDHQPNILVILDNQSIYKQIILQSIQDSINGKAHLAFLLHNQNLDVFEYYLNTYLDSYDFYIISPHFGRDKLSQGRAVKLLRKIPNQKLIMIDHWLKDVPGNYGAVYQDFGNDVYSGLSEVKEELIRCGVLKVVIMPNSMYGDVILESIKAFTREYGIKLSVYRSVPDVFDKGDVVLMLNSEPNTELTIIAHNILKSGLSIGTDIRLISYNEFPLNEVIMGGLTTISTDFAKMGRLAAGMALSGNLSKKHNDFRMTRRQSF